MAARPTPLSILAALMVAIKDAATTEEEGGKNRANFFALKKYRLILSAERRLMQEAS